MHVHQNREICQMVTQARGMGLIGGLDAATFFGPNAVGNNKYNILANTILIANKLRY